MSLLTGPTKDETLRALRVELAAAHRVAALEDLDEGTWNHFSVMVPGPAQRMLVTPGFWPFGAVTASSLMLMDSNAPARGAEGVNHSAWIIHWPIHQARPDAKCILHAHPPHLTALGMIRSRVLDERASQMAAAFYRDVAYFDDYDGALVDAEEGERMAQALGDKRVLILRNHGVLVVGPNISNALYSLYCLERAARLQLLAEKDGEALWRIPADVAESIRTEARSYSRYLEGMRRLLTSASPGSDA